MEIISIHGEAGYISHTKSQYKTQREDYSLKKGMPEMDQYTYMEDLASDGQEVQVLSGQLSNRTSEDTIF